MSLRTIRYVLCLAAALTPVAAQLPTLVYVDIPFDFNIANHKLSAGSYTIDTRISDSHVVLFQTRLLLNEPKPVVEHALALTMQTERFTDDPTPVVFFTRYRNNRYFVSSVWYGRTGIQLPRSKEELVTSKLVASAKPETVVLTARRIP